MTNKFTMREMIEETLAVYQGLYDDSLAEEQAASDAAAVKRIKKTLKKSSKPTSKKPESVYVALAPADKQTKVKLIKEKPKAMSTSNPLTDSETLQDHKDL
jgi:hypothetical protein